MSASQPDEKLKKKKPVRGAFIVFEGMDRAGKTTQAKLLQQRCIEEGKNVKFMRFPGTCSRHRSVLAWTNFEFALMKTGQRPSVK